MVLITKELRMRLFANRVSTLHTGDFDLPNDTVFEPPCSIKWMRAHHSLRLGAFSYAVSGYYFGVSMGRYVSIGEEVQIGRGNHDPSWASTSPAIYGGHRALLDFDLPEASNYKVVAPSRTVMQTKIGNDVWIGHGSFVAQGVHIGDGAVVGACSVVTKDVPPYSVVAGTPAVIRKMRFPARIIARMQQVAWWQYAFWDLSGADVRDPEVFLNHVEQRIEAGITEFKPELISLSEWGTT